MTNKYETLRKELETRGWGWMKASGNSMLPILTNPSTLLFVRQDTYAIGDIVFSKVNGRYIDAHMITKIGADGRFMISNNHNYDNGWTSTIYGKAVLSLDGNKIHYRST